MKTIRPMLFAIFTAVCCVANAQHLLWTAEDNGKKLTGMTCIYGEIEVLATGPTIYYCGCNWWPGNPAGGYCGIQDAGDGRKLTIFSIWDTSPTLHPETIQAEARTQHNRFGGEGEGAHTHLDYAWPLKKVFRYYATKEQDATKANTLAKYYFYDEGLHKWVLEATISCPNNGNTSVETFGGALYSFLENWSGRQREVPKVAIYRLWVGNSPASLVNLCEVRGDGKWGTIGDDFYMAEGDDAALAGVFKASGKVVTPGSADRKPMTVKRRAMPHRTVKELENLPKG
jgi:hypothetical protein